MKKITAVLAIIFFTIIVNSGTALTRPTVISIGTGGITGVYYPTGGAIAKIVNKKKNENGVRALVDSTSGSVFNVNAVMAGDLEFGVVQSDRQFQAMNGMAEWKKKGPQTGLRAVFSIYPEAVTLVAAADAGITSSLDLRGKRVNIGNPGSGQRQNSIDALNAVGINYETDIQAESIKASEAAGLLQDHRIDAFFYTVGHPSGAITEATSGARKVVFARIDGIETLLENFPYYTRTTVPIAPYPGVLNKTDIETFGVRATLITSAKVPDYIVYTITREIFENFEEFKKLHPAYTNLTKESMLTGLSAPIHPGALKYYREAGLK